jgi:hypothetical protein
MPARSLAIGPAVCEQLMCIRQTPGLLSALYVKRLYADRLKARFMRQRTDASLFSSFLHFRLYAIWLIGLHRSIGV